MQKALNIVNVCVQGFFILLLCLLVSFDSDRKFLNTDNFLAILIIEVLLGSYQTIHALVTSIRQMAKQKLNGSLKLYWLFLFLFFLSIIPVLIMTKNSLNQTQEIYNWMLFGWIPLLYYFIISIRNIKIKAPSNL